VPGVGPIATAALEYGPQALKMVSPGRKATPAAVTVPTPARAPVYQQPARAPVYQQPAPVQQQAPQWAPRAEPMQPFVMRQPAAQLELEQEVQPYETDAPPEDEAPPGFVGDGAETGDEFV
jgi:hypothetical protein